MEITIGITCMVALVVIAFYSGLKLAERYARERERAVQYALKQQFYRLRAGTDADDPCGPYVSPDHMD